MKKIIFLFLTIIIFSCSSSGNDESIFNEKLFIVTQWNELMLAGIRDGSARPTVTTRQMFIVSSAMYDAWSAYSLEASSLYLDNSLKQPEAEHTQENINSAVSQAAYHTLTALFNDYEGKTGNYFKNLTDLGYEISTDTLASTPESIGYLAAKAVLEARAFDGSNEGNDYSQVVSSKFTSLYSPINSPNKNDINGILGENFNPNRWTPVRVPNGRETDENGNAIEIDENPDSFTDQEFLTPHWGAVTPFSLESPDMFRPIAPPQYGSSDNYTDSLGRTMTNNDAWNLQVDQVIEFSANLTDTQKVIAEFWADGPRTEAPPGHWNQLAHGVSLRDNHTVEQDVKMYFALNGALLDAGIATWEAKRAYDFIRPVTAIRWKYQNNKINSWGGPNQGTQEISGANWRPYQNVTFVTPPFPEFVSGHSTFSRAAAEVLTAFTGSSKFYDGVTKTSQDVNSDGVEDFFGEHIQKKNSNAFESSPENDVILRWNTFYDAANEAGLSRLYGGIHILDGDLRGRELGEKIGKLSFSKASNLWN